MNATYNYVHFDNLRETDITYYIKSADLIKCTFKINTWLSTDLTNKY